MISTRSVGLLIDTVVCLTLAKWETVSGRFGGYLSPALISPRAGLFLSPGRASIGTDSICSLATGHERGDPRPGPTPPGVTTFQISQLYPQVDNTGGDTSVCRASGARGKRR